MKLLCAIMFLIPCFLFSQNLLHESISKFNKSNSVFDKARLASDIAWDLKDINPDSSLYYAQQALRFSKNSNQKIIEAYSLSDIGNYHKRKENYNIALQFYLESLSLRNNLGELENIAGGYNQIGLLYKQQEKYDSAVHFFEKGISFVRGTEYKGEILRLYNGYAMTLYHLGKPESALVYLDSTLFLANQLNDSLIFSKCIQNKGVINQYLGYNRLALKFYEEANEYYVALGNTNGIIEVMINQATVYLDFAEIEKAEQLLLAAEKLSLKHGFNDNLLIIYMDLGELYKSKSIGLRKIYLEKAYENATIYNKVPATIEVGIQLGLLALEKGNKIEAFNKLSEVKNIDAPIPKKNQFDIHFLESKFWEASNDYKQALNYSNKALILNQSLNQDLNELQDISALLNNEKYEKEIALEQLKRIQADKERIKAKLSRDKIIIAGLILGVALLILLFFSTRKRLKIEHELKIKEERFKNEQMQKTHEANLHFLEESLKLETEIRQRIGRDLHDQLGSKLAVIQIRLESIIKRIFSKDKEIDQLNDIIDLVDNSCKELRVVSHDLITHDFSIYGLNKSLKNHCNNVSSSGQLNINYSLIGTPYTISPDIKKHLYATIILLIDNIIQHANAQNASLQLYYHDDCTNVELDDDGIGFNPILNQNNGVGIANAKKRVENLGGTIEINSNRNQGTFISITIPTK